MPVTLKNTRVLAHAQYMKQFVGKKKQVYLQHLSWKQSLGPGMITGKQGCCIDLLYLNDLLEIKLIFFTV